MTAEKQLDLIFDQLEKELNRRGGAASVAVRMKMNRSYFAQLKRRQGLDMLKLLKALEAMEIPPEDFFCAVFGRPDPVRWLEPLAAEGPPDPEVDTVIQRIERLVAEKERKDEQAADR